MKNPLSRFIFKFMFTLLLTMQFVACKDNNGSQADVYSETDSSSDSATDSSTNSVNSDTESNTTDTHSSSEGGTSDSASASDSDSRSDTAADTATHTENDTDTDTDTNTYTDPNPLTGIWVSRAPGAYFTYNVLEVSGNTFWESDSNLSHVEHYLGTIESINPDAGQFFVSDATSGTNTPWYCAYSGTDSAMAIYFDNAGYPEPSGGMEGQEFYTYSKVNDTQCRRYVAAADLLMDGEAGTIECGFSADMIALYCTMKTASESITITQGYADFASFLTESPLPGKQRFVFEQHPGGYENYQYNNAGDLVSTSGSSGGTYEIAFDTWDNAQRPLTGTMTFLDIDCSPTSVVRRYDDGAKTKTEELLFENATGTQCPTESRTTIETFDNTGFMVSRVEYDGVTMTSQVTFTNPQMGIACEFETCPNAASLPTGLNQIYDISVAGDWEGTASLDFFNGVVTLSNVNLQQSNGSYQFVNNNPWAAFCIKEYGDTTLLAFEKKIPTSPPDANIQQVIHLALPTASLGNSTIAGTYNHGSWINGTSVGTVTLTVAPISQP